MTTIHLSGNTSIWYTSVSEDQTDQTDPTAPNVFFKYRFSHGFWTVEKCMLDIIHGLAYAIPSDVDISLRV